MLAGHRENKARYINICGHNAEFVMLKQMVRAISIVLQKVTIYIKVNSPLPPFFLLRDQGLRRLIEEQRTNINMCLRAVSHLYPTSY